MADARLVTTDEARAMVERWEDAMDSYGPISAGALADLGRNAGPLARTVVAQAAELARLREAVRAYLADADGPCHPRPEHRQRLDALLAGEVSGG